MIRSTALACDAEPQLDPAMVKVMVSAATYQSNRLTRSMRLQGAERDDVRQEVLLVLVERHRYFDAARGPWTPFVHRVANQAVQQIADRMMRDHRLCAEPGHGDADVDERAADLLDQTCDPAALTPDDIHYCAALIRFAYTLPDELVPVFEAALCADGALGDAQRESGLTSSEFHRRLRELRYRLVTAGLAPRHLLPGR